MPLLWLLPGPEQALQRDLWRLPQGALVPEQTVLLILLLPGPDQVPWELPMLRQCALWLALETAQSACALPLWLHQLRRHSHPWHLVCREVGTCTAMRVC